MGALGLSSLPAELQLRTLQQTRPFDILHIRQTCKTFHNISQDCELWKSVLRRLVDQNLVFKHTFDMDQMTLLELEYAATCPGRFRRWGTQLGGQPERSLRLVKEPGSNGQRTFSALAVSSEVGPVLSLHLVLGGKYLVAAGQRWLTLWDLDSVTDHPMSAVPAKYDSQVEMRVHATSDQEGLSVFLSYEYGDDEVSFSVYEIFPNTASPQFKQIAECNVVWPFQICTISTVALCNGHLFVLDEENLSIWDLADQLWYSIVVGENMRRLTMLIVLKGEIAVVDPKFIKVWPFPDVNCFQYQDIVTAQREAIVIPPRSIITTPSTYDYHRFNGPCGWYAGILPRSLLDHLFGLPSTFSIQDEELLQCMVSNIDAAHPVYYHIIPGHFHQRLRIIYGDCYVELAIQPWKDFIRVRTSKIAAQHTSEQDDPGCFPYEGSDGVVQAAAFTFCPFSGRLAFFDHEGHGNTRVIDLLERPPP